MKNLLKWGGIILLILIIVGAFSSNSDKTNATKKIGEKTTEQATVQEATEAPPQAAYKVGDIVQSGEHVFVINNVRKDVGSQFLKPKAGFTYLVVDATIENKSKEKLNISTLLQMYVKDTQGTKYTPTVGATTTGSLDGEIVAGDKSKGEVTFEVPASATGLKFYYEAGWLTGETIIVDLGQ